MNRYWLGIGAGALAVFGVGMGGIALGRQGLHELKTAVAGPVANALQRPIGQLRFQLDGQPIGQVQSVEVQSDGQWTDNAIRLGVTLDEAAEAGRLSACGIAGDRFHGRTRDGRFRCVSPADIEQEGLVQIGEVVFAPAGVTRPLFVTRHDRRKLERSDLKSINANLTSNDGKTVEGRATFDIEGRGGHREQGVITLHAGDGRALIDIRDASGKRLFHLNADEQGVSLKANDRRGRELVRLLAGEAGINLNVDR